MTSGDLPRAFLALPAEGEVGFLRLQRRLRLLAARALLSHPLGDLPDDLAAGLHAFRPSLTMALKAHSGPVLAAIGRPDVLPHLLCLHDGVGAEEAAQCLQVAVPALMAALAGQSQIQLRWTAPVRRVMDPQHHRVVVFDPPVDGLVAQAEGLMAVQGRNRWWVGPERPGVQVSHAHRPIRSDLPNLHLALPSGDSVDEASISACLSRLKTALDWLEQALPLWWKEAQHSLDRVVLLTGVGERGSTLSRRQAPGQMGVTVDDSPLDIATSLIRQVQHGKLDTLAWFDPILNDAHGQWVPTQPVGTRRPLWDAMRSVQTGVVLAAFYDRLCALDLVGERDVVQRWARQLDRNGDDLNVCRAHGEPTGTGAQWLSGLQSLHEALVARAPSSAVVDGASESLRDSFYRNGFVQGIDVLSPEEAAQWRQRLEQIEQAERARQGGAWADRDFYPWENPEHPMLEWMLELCQHPRLLDVVSAVLGPDLLIRNADLFIKEPQLTGQAIAWHWDSSMRDPSADGFLSVWLGLTPSTPENGGMRFLRGAHRMDLPDAPKDRHHLNFSETALKALEGCERVDNRMDIGQASMHHVHMPHSSGLNHSADRRMGLVIRFMRPSVSKEMAESGVATLVRGRDRAGHFELRPTFPITWSAAIP